MIPIPIPTTIDGTIYRTFTEWSAAGLHVRKGEKARHYLVDPENVKSRYALFGDDQVESLGAEDHTGWIVVSADEVNARKSKDPVKRVKLDVVNGAVTVWCGRNKAAIADLKRAGYSFDMRSQRWYHSGKQVATSLEGWRARDYEVELGPGAQRLLQEVA